MSEHEAEPKQAISATVPVTDGSGEWEEFMSNVQAQLAETQDQLAEPDFRRSLDPFGLNTPAITPLHDDYQIQWRERDR